MFDAFCYDVFAIVLASIPYFSKLILSVGTCDEQVSSLCDCSRRFISDIYERRIALGIFHEINVSTYDNFVPVRQWIHELTCVVPFDIVAYVCIVLLCLADFFLLRQE